MRSAKSQSRLLCARPSNWAEVTGGPFCEDAQLETSGVLKRSSTHTACVPLARYFAAVRKGVIQRNLTRSRPALPLPFARLARLAERHALLGRRVIVASLTRRMRQSSPLPLSILAVIAGFPSCKQQASCEVESYDHVVCTPSHMCTAAGLPRV